MEQAINTNSFESQFLQTENAVNIFSRFLQWCEQQEGARFLWLGMAFMVNIGMALPLTLVSINYFAGGNFILWIATAAVNVPVLALNLAAQPTKVTLPFLFAAWAVNLVVILASVVIYLS